MTAALIIATGKTATGNRFQAMKQIGGLTAVERLITVFQRTGAERVVVVDGEDHQKLERHLARTGAICLHNPNYQGAQMLDNVKLGLEYLQGKCRRVLITPVDVPLFSQKTVEAMMEGREKLVIPSHGKKGGHPILLSAKLFPKILGYEGEGGLSGAIKQSGVPPTYLEVEDEGVLMDVQKQSDYDDLVRRHSLGKIHPEMRLYLARERHFFGPGPFLLLSLIDETDSLRTACEQMGISYSKGWKMVENLEQQYGRPVVNRKRGGKEKGRSDITEEGKWLLEHYAAFVNDCRAQTEKLFKKHFSRIADF